MDLKGIVHMLFALLNSTRLVTDVETSLIAQAVNLQLARDIAPAWGRVAPRMLFYKNRATLPAGASVFELIDADPNVPNALGYHDESKGLYYAPIECKPIFDAGGDALTASTCVASVVSHEAAEMFGDAPVNIWADMPNGASTAFELADAVQDGSYPIKVGHIPVTVSNFLLPAWFDRQATKGPFDHLGVLEAPFKRTPGGYMIVRVEGKESEMFGALPAFKQGNPRLRHVARGL